MAVCPFCGNEVEEYDCICVSCGNTLPVNTSNNNNAVNTYNTSEKNSRINSGYNPYGQANPFGDSYSSYNQNNTAGNNYNPYGQVNPASDSYSSYNQNNTAGNNYNPYGQANPFGDSYSSYNQNNAAGNNYNPYGQSNPAGDSYNSYNPNNTSGSIYNSYGQNSGTNDSYNSYSQYGGLNESYHRSNISTADSVHRRNYRWTWKVPLIAIFCIMAAIILIPIINAGSYKKYETIVNEAVVAIVDEDTNLLMNISAFEYEKMLRDLSGTGYHQTTVQLENYHTSTVNSNIERYGSDYTIRTKIKSVVTLTGNRKKEALSKAESEYDSIFAITSSNLQAKNYIDESKIKQIKRIKVTAVIEGSYGNSQKTYWVDIVKFSGESEWKVLEIYETTR